jgi:hypothetical protein
MAETKPMTSTSNTNNTMIDMRMGVSMEAVHQIVDISKKKNKKKNFCARKLTRPVRVESTRNESGGSH